MLKRKDKGKINNTNRNGQKKNNKKQRKTKKSKTGKKKSTNVKRRQRKQKKEIKNKEVETETKGTSTSAALESRNATCSGASLGDSCLADLLTAMKFEKDKIRTFTNQKKRAESFKKITEAKGGKDGQFGNTTVYLLMALGGNLSNLACGGKPSLTTQAASTYM